MFVESPCSKNNIPRVRRNRLGDRIAGHRNRRKTDPLKETNRIVSSILKIT